MRRTASKESTDSPALSLLMLARGVRDVASSPFLKQRLAGSPSRLTLQECDTMTEAQRGELVIALRQALGFYEERAALERRGTGVPGRTAGQIRAMIEAIEAQR